MNSRRACKVRCTNSREMDNHMQANHTRNIAVGSTAIRQAVCPIMYGEELWWCPVGVACWCAVACSSLDNAVWTWHSRMAAASVQTSRMVRSVQVLCRITMNTTYLCVSAKPLAEHYHRRKALGV